MRLCSSSPLLSLLWDEDRLRDFFSFYFFSRFLSFLFFLSFLSFFDFLLFFFSELLSLALREESFDSSLSLRSRRIRFFGSFYVRAVPSFLSNTQVKRLAFGFSTDVSGTSPFSFSNCMMRF